MQGKSKFVSALAGCGTHQELSSGVEGPSIPPVHTSGRVNFRLVLVWFTAWAPISSKSTLGTFPQRVSQLYSIRQGCCWRALKPLCTVSQTAGRTGWLRVCFQRVLLIQTKTLMWMDSRRKQLRTALSHFSFPFEDSLLLPSIRLQE